MFSSTSIVSLFILASTANAFDFSREIRRFLQDEPAAPFDLSASLGGSGSNNGNLGGTQQEEDESGGANAAIIATVVVLLLLCCCLGICCIGGFCYYNNKRNKDHQEQVMAQKNLQVPYGAPQRNSGFPQQHYSDAGSTASGHVSYD